MAHLHPCDDCDVFFPCDELEMDTEAGGQCSVEPARCPSCADRENEAAYERMLGDYYGGSSDQTDRERMASADRLNREGRY